ncbi:MAG TPA: Rpn family recombination-promoting nuclease/putative transposase [Thermoanaerobaculia bacterium]|nr:Rpn family recombination-promoting nuclease/putative transposase [Thermoanaerobaculia bacterium]
MSNPNGKEDPKAEHDTEYKKLFSHPRSVEELLRGFLGEDWCDQLDFTTLQRVGSSFVTDDFRERHSDVIWRLRFREEADGWFYVYLLLEFQSTPDRFMAVRLLVYVGLLLQEIIEKKKLSPKRRLPAILPIVAYNGKRPWNSPLSLSDLFVPMPAGLQARLPQLCYQVLDANRLDLDRPDLDGNLAAALFRLEVCDSPGELPGLSRDLASLLPPGKDPELRRTYTAWLLKRFQRFFPGVTIPDSLDLEDAPMLEQSLIEWEQQFLKKGRREGRQEGRVEGMRRLLLKQLEDRFGPLPPRTRQRVEEISSARRLERLATQILHVNSLAEMGLA